MTIARALPERRMIVDARRWTITLEPASAPGHDLRRSRIRRSLALTAADIRHAMVTTLTVVVLQAVLPSSAHGHLVLCISRFANEVVHAGARRASTAAPSPSPGCARRRSAAPARSLAASCVTPHPVIVLTVPTPHPCSRSAAIAGTGVPISVLAASRSRITLKAWRHALQEPLHRLTRIRGKRPLRADVLMCLKHHARTNAVE